ncbi:PilZ domain-containing protein [Novosphingobium anseongense]
MALGNRLGEMMDGSENRQIARDSLFVMADLRLPGSNDEHRIKVRNLSAGGLMGEGAVRVSRGDEIEIKLRNVGWVAGSVAWVQDDRFGVAFRDEIDPKVARASVGSDSAVSPLHRPAPREARALRKI